MSLKKIIVEKEDDFSLFNDLSSLKAFKTNNEIYKPFFTHNFEKYIDPTPVNIHFSEWENWTNFLTDFYQNYEVSHQTPSGILMDFFRNVHSLKSFNNKYENVLLDLNNIHKYYIDNMEEGENAPSLDSLKHLIRYMPVLYKYIYHFNVDPDTGFFSIYLKNKFDLYQVKPSVSLLVKNNGEIVFSIIKEKTGFISTSGKVFIDNISDSSELEGLLHFAFNWL